MNTPSPVTAAASILFFYNGIKAQRGAKLEGASYYLDAQGRLVIRAGVNGFSPAIHAAFPVANESDSRSDYFDRDKIRLAPGHPCYPAALAALEAAEAKFSARVARAAGR
jgi:hypothetical protein